MEIYLRRATGFFGMASPLALYVNGEKYTTINHNEEKKVQVPESSVLQIRFFWSKSNQMQLSDTNSVQRLVVTMNPFVLQAYVCFFLLTSFFGLILNQPVALLIGIFIYGCLLPYVLKKVYVIKEETYG